MKKIKQQKKALRRSKSNYSITLDSIAQMQTNRDFKNIINLQSIILKKFFNDYRVLTVLGKANQENGNIDQAIHFLNLSLRINPNYIIALNNLGNIYNYIGKFDEAISLFLRAIKNSPTSNILYLNLGNSYWGQEDYNSAVEHYNKSLSIDPTNFDVNLNLANSYFKMHHTSKAMEHIIISLRLRPDLINVWKQFGYICSHTVFEKFDQNIADKINLLLDQCTNYSLTISKSLFGKLKKHLQINEFLSLKKENYNVENIIDICFYLNKTYFPKLLSNLIITDIDFFILCQNLREFILLNCGKFKENKDVLNIIQSIAKQCHINEYIFNINNKEKIIFNKLKNLSILEINRGRFISELELYVLSSYEYLDYLHNYVENLDKIDTSKILSKIFKNSLKEKEMQSQFLSTKILDNTVSQAVSSMYEENPYPRWEVESISQDNLTMRQFANYKKLISHDFDCTDKIIKVLVAGCGTGQQIVSLSGLFKNSLIDAIDISAASLAYAKRKVEELKLDNINFSKTDILDLQSFNKKYDYIECSGVLHHMEDPEKGFEILVNSLNSNGIIKVGLYSSIARSTINKAREFIKNKNIKFSIENLRDFRTNVIEKEPIYKEFDKLLNYADFYSTSNCRDLLFHIQEKQYNLKDIKKLIDKFNMKFAGFDFNNQYTHQYFKNSFPQQYSEYNLNNWEKYEQENIDTFLGMYNFFLIK